MAGKPFEVVDGRLIKTGPEQWELDGLDGPAIDDHILDYDQRWELVAGELLWKPPAAADRGRAHARVASLLGVHEASGHTALINVLTRYGVQSDFGPDVSVRPLADAVTGARRVDSLVVELRSERPLSLYASRARIMASSGVRRVLCLDLEREHVLAWDAAADDWRAMAAVEAVADACLVCPLPVEVLLDPGRHDAAVVAALSARRAPALEVLCEEGRARGRRDAAVEMLLTTLDDRGLDLDRVHRDRIEACDDLDRLRRWRLRAVAAEHLDDVFDDG